tara:strand:- start:133 stop:393 length:261 start_codon:yes stop_codon:yes gene_type:complete
VKETDDGKTIDGQDAGAVPAASTKHEVSYEGIFKFAKAMNTYYYTPDEWSRSIGWGTVPDERNSLLGAKQDRLTDENLQEDLDTKT